MIVLDENKIVIEDLDQILMIEPERIRCLLKKSVLDLRGSHFSVYSLCENELIVHGKCRSIELNER